MKHLANIAKKFNKLISYIVHTLVYLIILVTLAIVSFAFYLKVKPLDINYAIDYLKEKNILEQTAEVSSLTLHFDRTFYIVANDIKFKNDFLDIYLKKANLRIARTSIFQGKPSIKTVEVDKAKILLDLDKVPTNKSIEDTSKKTSRGTNYHAALKQAAYIDVLGFTKKISIKDSNFTLIADKQTQEFKKLNLSFIKSSKDFELTANGKYELNNNTAPFKLNMSIPNFKKNEDITLNFSTSNIKVQDLINSFYPNDDFNINGQTDVTINANLKADNSFTNVNGSAVLQNGYISITDLYNNKLPFKKIQANFNYDTLSKKITLDDTSSLLDDKNNVFKLYGDFSNTGEVPVLNISAETKKIDLMKAFTYIPDLGFKEWLDENITEGKASNVKFSYLGKLIDKFDGENGNPYFDIQADFTAGKLTYLEGYPVVENLNGHFNMLKNNIDISVSSATSSQQTVKRANVSIAPIFDEEKPTLITVKVLSEGSVEDVLNVLDESLKLNQHDLFKHYKGTQETQSTIIVNLSNSDNLSNVGTEDEKFILVNVVSDVSEIVGVDPIFKQRFEATDAIVKVSEEDLNIDLSGFINESPFHLKLHEKFLEFGDHTSLVLNSNIDSYIVKEYINLPGFNLSGMIDTHLELKKENDNWNFNVDANLENSLLNIKLLNYTKPYTKKGIIKTSGYYNQKNNTLNLSNTTINAQDFKANGSALIDINNFKNSKIEILNAKIKDKTDIDEFSYKNKMLTIKGKSLDLRPLILIDGDETKNNTDTTGVKNNSQDEISSSNSSEDPINRVNIRLDNLFLNDDNGLHKVTVLLNLTNTITGLIKAQNTKDSQSFYLKLSPVDEDSVKVESIIPSFGEFLNKTDIYPSVKSGYGFLSGYLHFKNKDFDVADLSLKVKNFQLLDAPILATALSKVSLEQLFTKKEGILFYELNSKIDYDDGIVKISETRFKGPSLGIILDGAYDTVTKTSDFNGTLVPIVKLNSVLGTIPVFGYILTGSQGAISGADFKVYTKNNEDRVTVAPLSVVTPGIVKDLFESISNKKEDSKVIKKAREKANIQLKESN